MQSSIARPIIREIVRSLIRQSSIAQSSVMTFDTISSFVNSAVKWSHISYHFCCFYFKDLEGEIKRPTLAATLAYLEHRVSSKTPRTSIRFALVNVRNAIHRVLSINIFVWKSIMLTRWMTHNAGASCLNQVWMASAWMGQIILHVDLYMSNWCLCIVQQSLFTVNIHTRGRNVIPSIADCG